MKKIKIVQFIGILLFIIYVTLLLIDLTLNVLGDVKIIVFSCIMALISINLIAKGVILKSSSTLWFSITLILCAILIAVLEILQKNVSDFYYIFIKT